MDCMKLTGVEHVASTCNPPRNLVRFSRVPGSVGKLGIRRRFRHLTAATGGGRYNKVVVRKVVFRQSLITLLVCAAMYVPGCSKGEPGFELMTLEGKIEAIDVKSQFDGEITVLYYSEKHKQEMIGTGLITRETEIMINGAIAKLADLREGDRVRGEVRVEKKRGKKVQTALKISVSRARPTGTPGG